MYLTIINHPMLPIIMVLTSRFLRESLPGGGNGDEIEIDNKREHDRSVLRGFEGHKRQQTEVQYRECFSLS